MLSSMNMNFQEDAFISYAHLDDQPLIEGNPGWVANFHRVLQIRVGQFLGKEPHIWRDPELHGNDVFADTLSERLRKVAALVAVLSPRYIRSDWTLRELTEFSRAAELSTGIRIGDKSRMFKVLKTPVPRDKHPPQLRGLLGYEFYNEDKETGRVRELDLMVSGAEAQTEFVKRIDDLAIDICKLIEAIECGSVAEDRPPVYLAEATRDLADAHDTIRRDLQDHAHSVVPPENLPAAQADLETYVRAQLSRCTMSIHLIGRNYGIVPEEWTESLPEIQYRLAADRAKECDFTCLVWISPGLEVSDERQRKFIGRLRADPCLQKGTELLETPLGDLRMLIYTRLEPPAPKLVPGVAADGLTRIYCIYDQRDQDAVAPWKDYWIGRNSAAGCSGLYARSVRIRLGASASDGTRERTTNSAPSGSACVSGRYISRPDPSSRLLSRTSAITPMMRVSSPLTRAMRPSGSWPGQW